jgi:hypothetical protein
VWRAYDGIPHLTDLRSGHYCYTDERSPSVSKLETLEENEEKDPYNCDKKLTHLERDFASLKDLVTQQTQYQRTALKLILQRLGGLDVSAAATTPSVAFSPPCPEELRASKGEKPSKVPEEKNTSQAPDSHRYDRRPEDEEDSDNTEEGPKSRRTSKIRPRRSS